MSVASEQAYELRGPSKVEEAHTCGILCTVFGLSLLDMTTPEARPIVRLLDGMGSALRFTLDHPLNHLSAIGQTTATLCAVSFVSRRNAFCTLDETAAFLVVSCRLCAHWSLARMRTQAASSSHRSWWTRRWQGTSASC